LNLVASQVDRLAWVQFSKSGLGPWEMLITLPCKQAATTPKKMTFHDRFSFAVSFAEKRSKRSIYTNQENGYYFKNALSYGSNAFFVFSIGECNFIWDQEVACSNHVAPTAFSECANSNPVRLMETGMFSFLVPDYQRFRRVSYGQP